MKTKITRESHPELVEEMLEHTTKEDHENILYVKNDIYECRLVVYLQEDYEHCPPEFQDKWWISNVVHGDHNYNISPADDFQYFTPCKRKKKVTYTYKEKS
jgi:hypothetical protein